VSEFGRFRTPGGQCVPPPMHDRPSYRWQHVRRFLPGFPSADRSTILRSIRGYTKYQIRLPLNPVEVGRRQRVLGSRWQGVNWQKVQSVYVAEEARRAPVADWPGVPPTWDRRLSQKGLHRSTHKSAAFLLAEPGP